MKKSVSLVLLGFTVLRGWADGHPKAAEIREYLDRNPIETRIPDLMVRISFKSSDLNEKGFQAYMEGRYGEAAPLFRQAVDADADNSFAWYNLACSLSLAGGSRSVEMLEPLLQAARRDWFWGLQLMVDPDIEPWRVVSVDMTVEEESPTDPGCAAFLHDLRSDGTVRLRNRSDCSSLPREIAVGYFCIVRGRLFEFFPKVDGYSVDGPNGPEPVPARVNRTWLPDHRFSK